MFSCHPSGVFRWNEMRDICCLSSSAWHGAHAFCTTGLVIGIPSSGFACGAAEGVDGGGVGCWPRMDVVAKPHQRKQLATSARAKEFMGTGPKLLRLLVLAHSRHRRGPSCQRVGTVP